MTLSINTTPDVPPLVVEMRGIVKRFPGVLANDHVDFELRRGEIHALLGENGAGKSTLMKIVAGAYRKDSGHIYLNGVETEFLDIEFPRFVDGVDGNHRHYLSVLFHKFVS